MTSCFFWQIPAKNSNSRACSVSGENEREKTRAEEKKIGERVKRRSREGGGKRRETQTERKPTGKRIERMNKESSKRWMNLQNKSIFISTMK